MKNLFLILFGTIAYFGVSQDRIITTKSDTLLVQIKGIDSVNVFYEKEDLNGSEFALSKDMISKIIHENGEIEVFKKNENAHSSLRNGSKLLSSHQKRKPDHFLSGVLTRTSGLHFKVPSTSIDYEAYLRLLEETGDPEIRTSVKRVRKLRERKRKVTSLYFINALIVGGMVASDHDNEKLIKDAFIPVLLFNGGVFTFNKILKHRLFKEIDASIELYNDFILKNR